MTFIKFCGMTRPEDVDHACELGVDALGFVLWPRSPRFVDVERLATLIRRMPPAVTPVGVFVAPSAEEIAAATEAGVRIAQVHRASEQRYAAPVWIATSVDADVDALDAGQPIVLDANDPERHGGTGRTIDWQRAAAIAMTRRVILAGGLTPANIRDAIAQVRPFGVDVASGIEDQPGIKNATAMTAFAVAVREASK